MFWVSPGVAGKHRTNTIEGEIRGTFGRGGILNRELEKQEGDTKNRNLEQWKRQDPGIELRSLYKMSEYYDEHIWKYQWATEWHMTPPPSIDK